MFTIVHTAFWAGVGFFLSKFIIGAVLAVITFVVIVAGAGLLSWLYRPRKKKIT